MIVTLRVIHSIIAVWLATTMGALQQQQHNCITWYGCLINSSLYYLNEEPVHDVREYMRDFSGSQVSPSSELGSSVKPWKKAAAYLSGLI